MKGNLISERVAVNANLDGACEPVCLYPDPGSTKDEGVGDRAVIVALGVPPNSQTGGGQGGELACGDYACRTPFGEREHGRERPQRLTRVTVADRDLQAPCSFETSLSIVVIGLSVSCYSRPQEKHAG